MSNNKLLLVSLHIIKYYQLSCYYIRFGTINTINCNSVTISVASAVYHHMLTQLPPEILSSLLSWLAIKDALAVAGTCSAIYQAYQAAPQFQYR